MRRFAIVLSIFATGWIFEKTSAADSAGLYLRGHGGYGGGAAGEFEPGGDEPSLGPVLGGEFGVNLFFFNAYLNHDRFLSRGSVSRGVVGLTGDLELAGFRLTGRIGAGLVLDRDPVFGGAEDHNGVIARAGLAFDRHLSAGLWLGLAIDAEYLALRRVGEVESSVHSGADIFASLRLSFELGI